MSYIAIKIIFIRYLVAYVIEGKLSEYKNTDICSYLKLHKNEQINDYSEINHWQNSCFLLSRTLSTIPLLNSFSIFF